MAIFRPSPRAFLLKPQGTISFRALLSCNVLGLFASDFVSSFKQYLLTSLLVGQALFPDPPAHREQDRKDPSSPSPYFLAEGDKEEMSKPINVVILEGNPCQDENKIMMLLRGAGRGELGRRPLG